MIVERRSDSTTACSARAFDRKKRVRWKLVAPIAEKKTKRSDPGALGGAQQAGGAEAVHLLEPARRLVADRRAEVDDGLDPAHRVPEAVRVAEVGERDLYVDPLGAEPARIAHERANGVPALEQLGDERRTDDAGCPRDQDHRWRHPTRPPPPAGSDARRARCHRMRARTAGLVPAARIQGQPPPTDRPTEGSHT